jgi:CRISPR-associated protein Csm3
MEASDFGVFENQWEISAKLNLVTPFRIGGGQNAGEYSLSQTPVLLSYDASTQRAFPYIPGSSLKGVLRSSLERIIRTFNEKEACIAVRGKNASRETKFLCGNCVVCSIFGSMEAGPKIHVRDSQLTRDMNFGEIVEERPHCKTDFDKVNGYYKVRIEKGKPKTDLRNEEIVASGTSFDVNIILDNATEDEVGLILLALEEFNAKRCYIGGSVSRGNGFADLVDVKVIKKTLKKDSESLFTIDEKECDREELLKGAKSYLRGIDDGHEVQRKDFDVYYHAYNPLPFEGNLVIKYKVETLTDFQMPGVDEATVTSMGVPVIPGSTIKGFLRHEFLKSEDGYTAEEIDEIFGSTSGASHRSRIIPSDAYPEGDFREIDRIPKGTTLTMWIVFDNIEEKTFNKINEILNKKPVITGKRVAGGKGSKDASLLKNRVKFTMKSMSQFTRANYLK